MAKKKATFKTGDVILHKEENKLFTIAEVGKYPKGKLYTLAEVTTNSDVEYKRYYQDKLVDKCVKTKNQVAAKVLFGKKK
jgi:type IV secretory pathway TraG/TraD family ATPase VirD4